MTWLTFGHLNNLRVVQITKLWENVVHAIRYEDQTNSSVGPGNGYTTAKDLQRTRVIYRYLS